MTTTNKVPYSWADAKPHPDEEDAVWKLLAKRGLAGSLIPSMLGLTDSPQTQERLTTYSQRMHNALRHSEDHLPVERMRALVDRLVNEGWTVQAIAAAAGTSRTTISRVRRDGTWVRREFVERLEGAAA